LTAIQSHVHKLYLYTPVIDLFSNFNLSKLKTIYKHANADALGYY